MKYLILILFISMFSMGCAQDIKTTSSGLKYEDEKIGEGKTAEMGDMLTLHTRVWTVKDSSVVFEDWSQDSTKKAFLIGSTKEMNQPLKIPLGSGQFIKGCDEGIVGMKPGGKRIILIPSELAYGETGAGPVPPNTSLRVEIELIDAKTKPVIKPWTYDSSKVQTTASGLKYIMIQEGTGEQADSNDVVSVHYSGFLSDGNKFDSSVERDEPYTFTLGIREVIAGWEEGIALLKKGGKAKLIIPPALAYGERGMGPIPPNATLIFDVQLVDLQKK